MTSRFSSPQTVTDPDLLEGLSPQTLMANAAKETGLSNFGPDFLEPFTVLVESAAKEVVFSPIGLMAFKADMQRMLVNRLRFEEDLRLHPEILGEDVSDPIIILGLARTGTSKLQRMMSADPHVQKLYYWRLLNPAPFPGADPAAPDPRIDAARQATAMMQAMVPHLLSAHPMFAEEVDEETFMMEATFASVMSYLRVPAPSYYQWIAKRKLNSTYRYTERLMKYLQWQDGGKKGRPWIMKSPIHLGNLDMLPEVFPKATLVYCHRDVTEVIPSFCNVIEGSWRLLTDRIDPYGTGRALLELYSAEMKKFLKLRKELGPRVDIYDVAYTQIHADPMAIIREVYRRAGRPLGEDSVQAMKQWEKDYPKDRFGKNVYSLEQYGLSREVVESAFHDYIEQFSPYLKNGASHGA